MTWEEFEDWFSYHASRFTGLHTWLGKYAESRADARNEREPTQESILQGWFHTLAQVDLADAKRATDLLHAGDEPEPKGPDKIAGAVAQIARRMRTGAGWTGREEGPRIVGGVETVDCVTCQDWGRVWVWHPEDMARAAAGKLKPPFRSCHVACTCRAGNRYRRTHRLFDPKRDLPIRRADDAGQWRTHDWGDPAEHEALRRFVEAIHQQRSTAQPATDPQQEIPF